MIRSSLKYNLGYPSRWCKSTYRSIWNEDFVMWQSWWSCPYGRQNGRNCSNYPWPRIQSQFWTSTLICFVVTYLLLPVTKKCVTKNCHRMGNAQTNKHLSSSIVSILSISTPPWVIFMSHTLVTLPFSSSPRGHEVKNLQKNAYELHTPANIDRLWSYDLILRSYSIKILRVVNQSVITKTVFVPCFRSSDFLNKKQVVSDLCYGVHKVVSCDPTLNIELNWPKL